MAEPRDYEHSDVSVRGVLFAVGFGSLAIAAVAAALWLLTRDLAEDTPTSVSPGALALAPAPDRPRLQVDPQGDLAKLDADARRRLHATGWTDRDAGLAHIPIERAMNMIATSGWPEGAP